MASAGRKMLAKIPGYEHVIRDNHKTVDAPIGDVSQALFVHEHWGGWIKFWPALSERFRIESCRLLGQAQFTSRQGGGSVKWIFINSMPEDGRIRIIAVKTVSLQSFPQNNS
jgi:hypothetical protein